ncbi:MAG TPA: class D sortase, partial [Thermoflexia bacterium]|nr:class D sortase [Thermoflexia bacterium]
SIVELEELLRLRKRAARFARVRQQEGKPAGRELLDNDNALLRPDASPVRPPRVVRGGARYSAAITDAASAPPRRRIQWRWIWDRLLLLVELLAVLGLVMVVAELFLTVHELNEESRVLQMAPPPLATPLIDVALLPGGHTAPDGVGDPQPASIPAHLQHLVAEITPLPAPTPGPEQAQRIVIASIGVDAPVVEGDTWEVLKKGVGHHIGSANPGERGNCVLSAHNDIYGEIFRRLPDLKVGDEILLHTQTRIYRYTVQQTRIIEPTEVEVMAPTSSPALTLISCYPYGVDTHRIVVIASLSQ